MLVTPGVKRIVNTAFLAWLREVRFDNGGKSLPLRCSSASVHGSVDRSLVSVREGDSRSQAIIPDIRGRRLLS